MCDTLTEQLIERLVEERCRRGDRFTAFDVSLEAKQRGCRERHRDLKHVVHRSFERGAMGAGYVRRLIPIPGAVPAWLYHCAHDDPTAYRSQPRRSSPRFHSQAGRHQGRGLDRRERLSVPAPLLRRAGLRPGETVLVVADPHANCIVLTKDGNNPAAGALASYRVDRDGNVRLVQGTLQRAALGGDAYDIEGDGGTVTIRRHKRGAFAALVRTVSKWLT